MTNSPPPRVPTGADPAEYWRGCYDWLKATVDRSGLDISHCLACGRPVVCIPDGLPMCEPCAKEQQ